jgi:hypothetical protein
MFRGGNPGAYEESLKPLESIQAGDWELSRSENGQGELAYKRVTRTFKSENKAVWIVALIPQSEPDRVEREEGFVDSKQISRLIVTLSHRFGVKDASWIRVDYSEDPRNYALRRAYQLNLVNGETAALVVVDPLYGTLEPGIAWRLSMPYSGRGISVDLSRGGASAEFDYTLSRKFRNDGVEWQDLVTNFIVLYIIGKLRISTPVSWVPLGSGYTITASRKAASLGFIVKAKP